MSAVSHDVFVVDKCGNKDVWSYEHEIEPLPRAKFHEGLMNAARRAESPADCAFLEACARYASAAELDQKLSALRAERQIDRDLFALRRILARTSVRNLHLIADIVRGALEAARI